MLRKKINPVVVKTQKPAHIGEEMDLLSIKGFSGNAVAAAIKYQDRLDLGLLFSERPATVAATFTRNKVKAAPVLDAIGLLGSGIRQIRAILVNSGNANACTGGRGLEDVRRLRRWSADTLNISKTDILVSSTGVIGELLPLDRIGAAIPGLVAGLSTDGIERVAEAILTTDTVKKTAFRQIDLDGVRSGIYGMAKGSGMIGPNMGPPQATMLAFILTDLKVSPDWWQRALEKAVKVSFNRIVVDGDTSTNDTVLAMANGMAGNDPIGEANLGHEIEKILSELTMDLARQIVRDGEGATKCIELNVTGARSDTDAERVARIICESPLVKTAFFGEDPNWGRILAAAGRAGIELDPERLTLKIGDVELVKNGQGTGTKAEHLAKKIMKARDFDLTLDMGLGDGCIRFLTCDLSVEYVRINADYRT